jgi:hypothetical protein
MTCSGAATTPGGFYDVAFEHGSDGRCAETMRDGYRRRAPGLRAGGTCHGVAKAVFPPRDVTAHALEVVGRETELAAVVRLLDDVQM